jgi:hypothetical protein
LRQLAMLDIWDWMEEEAGWIEQSKLGGGTNGE